MYTVLVVEDDSNLRELFTLMLTMDGYEIVVASDGEEAINMLNANLPDLVVLDMNLPVISGFEVMRYIREQDHLRKLRVIIVSANSNAPSSDEAELADVVLMKPVTLMQLQTMVRRLTVGTGTLTPKEPETTPSQKTETVTPPETSETEDTSDTVNANDANKKPAT